MEKYCFTSEQDILEIGNSQRSAISPILFTFPINDLAPKGIKISMFSDDTAIWKTFGYVHDVINSVQRVLHNINK